MRSFATSAPFRVPAPPRCALVLGAALLASLALAACGDDEPGACASTSDCASNQACLEAVCQSITCTSTLECPTDAICYQPEGYCGPLQCRIDADCFADRRNPFCVDRRCVAEAPAECASRADCGAAEACSAEGECVGVLADAACTDEEDCGNPQICVPGAEGRVCADPCTADEDCTEGGATAICIEETGLCEAVECTLDEQCDAGRVCNDDNECDIERFPCDELVCSDPARPFTTEPVGGLCRCVACFTDENCDQPVGEVCVTGGTCLFCEASAASEDECPEDTPYLDSGCCLECRSDDDCSARFGIGSECDNGRCIPCDCAGDCECPEGVSCQIGDDGAGACLTGDGELDSPCAAQTDCAAGLACSYDRGVCVMQGAPEEGLCAPGCPSPSRCASTGVSALCYGCTDNDECPTGQTCQIQPEWVGVYEGGACFPN